VPVNDALAVHVEDPRQLTIEIVTRACAGDCADIQAVARGGNPPYAFAWDDGSINPMRSLCPTTDSMYSVRVMDTPIDQVEFRYAAHTASAGVTARVLACPSTTVQDATVYWQDGPTSASARPARPAPFCHLRPATSC
jgi:hypothetical protein